MSAKDIVLTKSNLDNLNFRQILCQQNHGETWQPRTEAGTLVRRLLMKQSNPEFMSFLSTSFRATWPSWYYFSTTQAPRWLNSWWSASQECRTHSTGYLLSWLPSWFWPLGLTLCCYSPSSRRHLCTNPCTTCLPSSPCWISSSASLSSLRSDPTLYSLPGTHSSFCE